MCSARSSNTPRRAPHGAVTHPDVFRTEQSHTQTCSTRSRNTPRRAHPDVLHTEQKHTQTATSFTSFFTVGMILKLIKHLRPNLPALKPFPFQAYLGLIFPWLSAYYRLDLAKPPHYLHRGDAILMAVLLLLPAIKWRKLQSPLTAIDLQPPPSL